MRNNNENKFEARKLLSSIVAIMLVATAFMIVLSPSVKADVDNVSVTNIVPDTAGAVNASYYIIFNVSETGELTEDVDWINITFPEGTVINAAFVAGTLSNGTVNQDVQGNFSKVGDFTLNITLKVNISNDGWVWVNLTHGITNPTIAGTDYTLLINTSQEPTPVPSATYTITADAPDSVEIVADGPTTIIAGDTLSFFVWVNDSYGNVITSDSDNATLVWVNATDGVFIHNTTVGTYVVNVSYLGIDSNPVEVTVTAGAADDVAVLDVVDDQVAGEVIGPVTVLVVDGFANPVVGVNVSVAEHGGYVFDDGTLIQETGVDGVATFDDLVIETVGVGYVLVFSNSSYSLEDSSDAFNVTAAAAASMIVQDQPAENTVAGDVILPVTVLVNDSYDNPVEGVAVTVGPANDDFTFSSGTLIQTTNPLGIATFNDLIIEDGGIGYQLNFSVVGIENVTSDPFNITDKYIFVNKSYGIGTDFWQISRFDNIQGAIDAANPDDIIKVHSETYEENIMINKPLILESADGIGEATINLTHPNQLVIISENVTVYGFNFEGTHIGIAIASEPGNFEAPPMGNVSILDNIFSGFAGPDSVLMAVNIHNITIAGNTFDNNLQGILLLNSSFDVNLTDNTFTSNFVGVLLFNSSVDDGLDDMLVNNTFDDNMLDYMDVRYPDWYVLKFGNNELFAFFENVSFKMYGAFPFDANIYNTTQVEVLNDWTISIGDDIEVFLPGGTNITKIGGGYFEINNLTSGDVDLLDFDELKEGFNFYTAVKFGIYDENVSIGLEFDQAINISVNVTDFGLAEGTTLAIFKSNSTDAPDWMQNDEIFDTTVIVNETGWITFQTKNASYFALSGIPGAPSNFNAETIAINRINLSWNIGQYADKTYIEWNSTTSWPRGEGEFVCNESGGSFSHTDLNPGTTYFYQAWSWNETDGYSILNESAWNTTRTVAMVTISPSPAETITAGDELVFTAEARDNLDDLITDDVTDFDWVNASDGVFDNNQTAGIHAVNATFMGVVSADTIVTVTAAAPANMDILVQPEDGVAGVSFLSSVLVNDTYDNAVEGVAVTVILNKNDFYESGGTVVTGADGIATFGALNITIADTGYNFTFTNYTGSEWVNATSDYFNITAAGADTMTIAVQPTHTVAGEAIDPAPAVLVVDEFDNPVSGVNVSVMINGGDFASGTVYNITNESGIALFADLVINTVATGYTLTFSNFTDAEEWVNATSEEFSVVEYTVTLSAGWNLISVNKSINASASDFTGGTPEKMYKYENGDFLTATIADISPVDAIFIKADAEFQLGIVYNETGGEFIDSKELTAGWNLISVTNLYNNKNISLALNQLKRGINEGLTSVYNWSAGVPFISWDTDLLYATSGYWVHMNEDKTFGLPYEDAGLEGWTLYSVDRPINTTASTFTGPNQSMYKWVDGTWEIATIADISPVNAIYILEDQIANLSIVYLEPADDPTNFDSKTLTVGWNLISVTNAYNHTAIDVALAQLIRGINEGLTCVFNYTGLVPMTSWGSDTLDATSGYWVHMNEEKTFELPVSTGSIT